jgi:NAD-dependent SIR2 family protein deacetylase/ankyrin repeat protein
MGLSVSTFFTPAVSEIDEAAFRLNELHSAVRKGSTSVVRQLLLTQEHLASETTSDGYTVFHLCSTISSNSVGLDMALALAGSREAQRMINEKDARGFAPCHLMASNGRTEMLEHLVPAMQLDVKTSEGRTALHLAVQHSLTVHLLLRSGLADSFDNFGISALHVAAMVGATESVHLLMQGKGREMVNTLSQHNTTPLMLACKNGHSATVAALLAAGADPTLHGAFGATALHRACEYGHVECVRLLLKQDETLPQRQDDDGQTGLHYVCGSSRLDARQLEAIVSLLAQACPAVVNQKDYSLATPLIKASFYVGRPTGPPLIRSLLRWGADPTMEYSHGWSAAHVLNSEDPTSPLLQEMLAKFNGIPWDPNKPRNVDNQLFQEKRGAWNRIPIAVRNSVFEGRTGLDAVLYRLQKARKIVVLSGAGISTSCGIPDFRSANGLYANQETRNMFDAAMFEQDPTVMYEGCANIFSSAASVEPSAAHRFLGQLEKHNKLRRVYDQNVDGITGRVVSSELIRECHGTLADSRCSRCALKTGGAFLDAVTRGLKNLPCPRCHAPVRPNVVMFGEPLPESFSATQFEDLRSCDLLLVLGTSLKVYPVAGLVGQVLELCPRVLINNEAVGSFNSFRDVQLLGNIDERVTEIMQAMNWVQ